MTQIMQYHLLVPCCNLQCQDYVRYWDLNVRKAVHYVQARCRFDLQIQICFETGSSKVLREKAWMWIKRWSSFLNWQDGGWEGGWEQDGSATFMSL